MSLNVAYSYCTNLTEEEKLEIDEQVRKDRLELKFAIFFPFLPFPMPQVPFFPVPVEDFSQQQIVRNARDRAESAVAEKLAPLAQLADDAQEATNPRVSNDSPPMERIVNLSGGDQSKFGPGPRAKAAARRNAQSSGSFLIPGADGGFVSSRNYRPYQKPLSARRPGKIQKGPFDPDQEQGKGRCKSEVQKTITYNIKSQIGNNKKLTKISNKIRKNPKLVQEFNGLKQKLRNGNMKAGRGVKPLSNSNGIYYARGYTEGARLYFKYSGDNIIVLGESNKPTQDAVIEFLLKNY